MLLHRLPTDLRLDTLAEILKCPLRFNQVWQDFLQLNFFLVKDPQLTSFFIDFVPLVGGIGLLPDYFEHHRFLHGFHACRSAYIREQGDSLCQGPRPELSLRGAVLAHLLKFVFDISRRAFSTSHLDKALSNDLPGLAVETDQPSKDLLLVLSPIAVVVVRIELAPAKVVACLHGPLLETLSDFWPSTLQVLGQFIFRARAKNCEGLHGIKRCLLLLHIVAKGVHECFDFLGREASLLKSCTFPLEIVPGPLADNVHLDLAIELHAHLALCLDFGLSLA